MFNFEISRREFLTRSAIGVGGIAVGLLAGQVRPPQEYPNNFNLFYKAVTDNMYFSAALYRSKGGWNDGTLTIILGEGRLVKTPNMNVEWPGLAYDEIAKKNVPFYTRFNFAMTPENILSTNVTVGSDPTNIWLSVGSNNLRSNRRIEDMHSMDIMWIDRKVVRVLYDLLPVTNSNQTPGQAPRKIKLLAPLFDRAA